MYERKIDPAWTYVTICQGTFGTNLSKCMFTSMNYNKLTWYSNGNFKPQRAGLYLINACVAMPQNGGSILLVKNDDINNEAWTDTFGIYTVSVSKIIWFNGTTDFISVYGRFTSANTVFQSTPFSFLEGFWLSPHLG